MLNGAHLVLPPPLCAVKFCVVHGLRAVLEASIIVYSIYIMLKIWFPYCSTSPCSNIYKDGHILAPSNPTTN